MSDRLTDLEQAVRVLAKRVLGEDLALSDVAQLAGPEPVARVAYDDTRVSASVVAIEQRVADVAAQMLQTMAHLRQLEADYQRLRFDLAGHTHEAHRSVA